MTGLRAVPVVLFGMGGVGQAVVKQILAARSIHASRYGLRFDFLALADSTGYLTCDSDAHAQEALALKQSKQSFAAHARGTKCSQPIDVVRKLSRPGSIVIDCSASDATAAALCEAIRTGCGVTQANKKPLSDNNEIFDTLCSAQNTSRCRYESTCGAGTPFITTLQRIVASGDEVTQVQGTFSGTLGYLMSALESGASYSSAVTDAYKKQYTEPDPRDDLSGSDVARKALILARTMGNNKYEMATIQIEALYPKEWASLTVPEFMAKLPEMDAQFAERNAKAKAEHKVLRYVATITPNEITVGLKALPKSSPLGQLEGTQNMAEFYSKIYTSPLVVQGAGAGVEVTAAGVIADCVELAQCMHASPPQQQLNQS